MEEVVAFAFDPVGEVPVPEEELDELPDRESRDQVG